MRIIHLIGRVILGGFYIWSSSHHFLDHAALTAGTASRGVPLPGLAVYGTGLLLLGGGLSILLGLWPKLGVAALVLFFLGVTPQMHNFWAADPAHYAFQLANFTKNFGLMASALVFLAIPEPWPLSLGRAKGR